MRRMLAALGLLVVGGLAAHRLGFGGRPEDSTPAVAVEVAVPDGTYAGPGEMSRAALVPVESAARSLGGVRVMSGEVSTSRGDLLVELAPGSDPELAAARVLAQLGPLRETLPEGAQITAWPASTSREPAMVVALTGGAAEAASRRVADVLAAIPGVRDVTIAGERRKLLRWRLRSGDATLAVAAGDATRRALAPERLGVVRLDGASVSGNALPVVSASGASTLADLAVRAGSAVLPMRSVVEPADDEGGRDEPLIVAHVDGRRAIVLRVFAERGVRLLDLDARIRRELAALASGGEEKLSSIVITSQADAGRHMLRRLALALALAGAAATLLGAWLGGAAGAWRLALAVPLALASALVGLWACRLAVDLATAPAIAFAVLAALPLAARRIGARPVGIASAFTFAGCALLLPLALAAGATWLRAEVQEPARAFGVAAAFAALSTLVLPVSRWTSTNMEHGGFRRLAARLRGWRVARGAGRAAPPSPSPRARRLGIARFPWMSASLRDPSTVLLTGVTVAWALLAAFGEQLEPDSGRPLPPGRFLIALSVAEGTSLRDTELVTTQAEERCARIPSILRTWSWTEAGDAQVVAEVRPADRAQDRLQALRERLRMSLAAVGASVRVDDAQLSSAGTGSPFVEPPGEVAWTDEGATRYRFLLRATDERTLEAAAMRVLIRGVRMGNGVQLELERGAPSVRVDLVPRPGVKRAQVEELAGLLKRASSQPPALRLPGRQDGQLVVAWPGALNDEDEVPQRVALLERPLLGARGAVVPATLVQPSDTLVQPTLEREDGRFVLPVTAWLRSPLKEGNEVHRKELDRALAVLRLPEGSEMERPRLRLLAWTPQRIRRLAPWVAAPLLLLAAATFRLGSVMLGAMTLPPLAVGVAMAAAHLRFAQGGLDQGAFVLLLGALCATIPVPLQLLTLVAARGARSGAMAAWRPAREWMPAVALGAGAFLLLAASTFGLDAAREPWTRALRTACLAGAAGTLASLALVPAAALLAREWWRRRQGDPSLLSRPLSWRERDVAPALSLRHVTKVYGRGASAHRALRDVSLELGAGVVGLLGPNGAGKTTLLRILTGLVSPTRGEVAWQGLKVEPLNLAAYRAHFGFLPQEFNAYPGLSGRAFLDYWGMERGMSDGPARRAEIATLLEDVGLTGSAHRKVRDYSGGMRQRLGIARALLGSPRMLIVDEPTTGLDIESRARFREALLAVAARRLVILSTHVASDVEATASRLLLLYRGCIRFDGAPSALIERAQGRVFEVVVPDAEVREMSRRYRVTARVRVLEGIRVRGVASPSESVPGAAVRPALEEAYLAELDRIDPSRRASEREGSLG